MSTREIKPFALERYAAPVELGSYNCYIVIKVRMKATWNYEPLMMFMAIMDTETYLLIILRWQQ